MNELQELESGIARLKRDSQSKKVLIDALEKEKAELIKRSDELSQRIVQTNEAYKESARKIMDYVKSQTSGLRADLAGLSNSQKMLSDLESRLESQEASHSRILKKVESDLAVINKSLSDVEAVKKELASQRAFVQEAKLQMEKGLQSGVAYLRKEMDLTRREEAKKAMEQFRQEIERVSGLESELNAFRQSQEKRVDKLSDSLAQTRSGLQEVKLLRERSSGLEEAVQRMESKLDSLHSKQKTAEAVIDSELSKRLDRALGELKKDLESRRSEDLKARLSEFRQEISRISGVEQTLRQNEKRMDGLASELSKLHNTPEDIKSLRESVEEAMHMNHSLADRTVSVPDFEKTSRSVSKRIEDLESRLFSLDKRLASDKGRLEKAILEVLNEEKVLEGTQKNIRDWFDAKFQDIDKRVSQGLDALTTQLEDGSALMDSLRKKTQKTELLTKQVPKKIEEHDKAITRLIDSKSGLAASLGELSGEIGSVSQNLSQGLQRIASLEKGLSSADRSRESSIKKLSADLAAYQSELKNQAVLLKEFSESSKLDASNLRSEVSAALKAMQKDLDDKAERVAESGLRAIKEKTQGLASIRDMSSELKVLKSGLSQIDSRNREATGQLEREIQKVSKSLDSRLNEITEGQASQFKKEFDYISRNIDSIRNISSDIKVFSSRLDELDRFTKGLVSQQDFSDKVKLLETKLEDLGVMARSGTQEVKEDLDSFRKTVTERLNQSRGDQLKEFRNEIQRVGSLEKQMGTYERITETRLKEITDALQEVQALPSELGVLRERLDSVGAEAEASVSSREFNQKIGHINSSFRELQSGLAGLEKRISSHSAELESSINEALAEDKLLKKSQKGMESIIDSRLADVEKRLTKGIEELSRDVTHNSSVASEVMNRIAELGDISEQQSESQAKIEDLRERLGSLELVSGQVAEKVSSMDSILKRLSKLESVSGAIEKNSDFLRNLDTKYSDLGSLVKTLPKTVDQHSRTINKLLESRDFLSETTGSLKTDLRGISERMDSLHERLAGVEKGFSSTSSEGESRVDQLNAEVRELKARLDSETSGMKEFRDSLTDRVNEAINSFEKRFGEFTSNLSSREIGKIQKTLSELSHLKERMSEIDGLSKKLSEGSVTEKEFVDTVRSISKRIESLEDQVSGIDKKASVQEADLDASVKRALSKEKILEVGQEKLREMLEKRMDSQERLFREKVSSEIEALKQAIPDQADLGAQRDQVRASLEERMKGIEQKVQERIDKQVTRLEKGISDISSLREEMAGIKALGEHLDADVMSKVGESMSNFSRLSEKAEKRIDSLSGELRDLNDSLADQRSRTAGLEQKLKSELETLEIKFREGMKKELLSIDSEISDETAKLMKEAEIGELKRKREFDKLLRQFQELQVKTQTNLEDINKHRNSFMELERSLVKRIDEHRDSIQAKVDAGHELLKKRLVESENMNMKLNNMVSELQMRLEKERNTNMDFNQLMSNLKEELIERMKTNEDMFDSEMDAFRNRIDSLMGKLNEWKDSKSPSGQAKTANLEELKVISQSLEDMDARLQDNREDMKKFKEYVTEYMNNLVKTYDSRMSRVKEDLEFRLGKK